jgi:hypothetical protein
MCAKSFAEGRTGKELERLPQETEVDCGLNVLGAEAHDVGDNEERAIG